MNQMYKSVRIKLDIYKTGQLFLCLLLTKNNESPSKNSHLSLYLVVDCFGLFSTDIFFIFFLHVIYLVFSCLKYVGS